jgi:WD40 repeat protein/mono/diheme cytochrome c family protein
VKFHFSMLLLLGWAGRLASAEVSFTRDIAPVFVAKCLACHNAEKAKGGYRMHHFDALWKKGSSDETPLVAGQPGQSHLFKLLTAADEDDRMPQKDDPLPPAQIALIKQWIEAGAKFDGPDRTAALTLLAPPRHREAPRAYSAPVAVTALAFDPSGEWIVTGGYHEIIFWNARSGELGRRIGGVAERTFELAFSPDGRWLAAASGTPGKIGEVKLFHATNDEPARVLGTTSDAALALTFSPDGRRLAAGGADNVIRIWEPAGAAKPLLTIEQHADWVLALAFSPDGLQLASASRDKSARVFDALTGELETTHTGHGDYVTSVTWLDNKTVLSGSREKEVHRWAAKDAKKSGELAGWAAPPSRLIVSSNRLFSAALERVVREHDVEKKIVAREFAGARDSVHALAWHAPSQRLAAGAHDGEVLVWDARDGKLLLKFLAAPGHAAKFSRPE